MSGWHHTACKAYTFMMPQRRWPAFCWPNHSKKVPSNKSIGILTWDVQLTRWKVVRFLSRDWKERVTLELLMLVRLFCHTSASTYSRKWKIQPRIRTVKFHNLWTQPLSMGKRIAVSYVDFVVKKPLIATQRFPIQISKKRAKKGGSFPWR